MDTRVDVTGLLQVAQSCSGMVVPLLVTAATLPPAPDSLHWKPLVAGSDVVLKAQVGFSPLVRIGGLEVMRATGRLQEAVVEAVV